MSSLVQGDNSILRLSIKNRDQSIPDLTGATVTLSWLNASGVKQTRNITVATPAATSGSASYKFLANEIFGSQMIFDLLVINAAGDRISAESNFAVTVRTPL